MGASMTETATVSNRSRFSRRSFCPAAIDHASLGFLVAGLRDRALIALMVYSFARIAAALGMTVEDVYTQNRRLWVRLREKGGKPMRCRATTTSKNTLSPISMVPGYARIPKGRCSAQSAAVPAS
jgi:integrase